MKVKDWLSKKVIVTSTSHGKLLADELQESIASYKEITNHVVVAKSYSQLLAKLTALAETGEVIYTATEDDEWFHTVQSKVSVLEEEGFKVNLSEGFITVSWNYPIDEPRLRKVDIKEHLEKIVKAMYDKGVVEFRIPTSKPYMYKDAMDNLEALSSPHWTLKIEDDAVVFYMNQNT